MSAVTMWSSTPETVTTCGVAQLTQLNVTLGVESREIAGLLDDSGTVTSDAGRLVRATLNDATPPDSSETPSIIRNATPPWTALSTSRPSRASRFGRQRPGRRRFRNIIVGASFNIAGRVEIYRSGRAASPPYGDVDRLGAAIVERMGVRHPPHVIDAGATVGGRAILRTEAGGDARPWADAIGAGVDGPRGVVMGRGPRHARCRPAGRVSGAGTTARFAGPSLSGSPHPS